MELNKKYVILIKNKRKSFELIFKDYKVFEMYVNVLERENISFTKYVEVYYEEH